MIKATVLYGHPNNPETFEKYYAETHVPLVGKTQRIAKAALTKFLPNPDGTPAAYYRMAELYFTGPAEMQQAMSSTEGLAMAADISNFAIGSTTIFFGTVEN